MENQEKSQKGNQERNQEHNQNNGLELLKKSLKPMKEIPNKE